MKVTYKPEDGDEQEWVFNPRRVRQSQAALIEKAYGGKTWDEFVFDVQAGSIQARRLLLWHLMSLQHPVLKLVDVPDFYADEVVISHDATELRAMLDGAEKNADGIPADRREVALSMLRGQLEAAEILEADEPAGKARSKTAP